MRRRPYPGTCRDCMKKRDVFSIRRSGGGTYRRGGRSYESSICGECATRRLCGGGTHAGATNGGFGIMSLDEIVSSLGTEEAAEVFTAWRDRRDVARVQDAERRAEFRNSQLLQRLNASPR